MSSQDLMDLAGRADTQHGKNGSELPCKYPADGDDLSGLVPSGDVRQYSPTHFGLSQAGASTVWRQNVLDRLATLK